MRALRTLISAFAAAALLAGASILLTGSAVAPAAASAADDKLAKKKAKKKEKKKALKAKKKGPADTGVTPADTGDGAASSAGTGGGSHGGSAVDDDALMDDDDDDSGTASPPTADKTDDKKGDKKGESKLPPPPPPGGTTIPDLPDISGGIGVVVDVPGSPSRKRPRKKDTIGGARSSGGGGFKLAYVGYAVAGLGVVGFGLAPVFGLLARSKARAIEDPGCTPMGAECPLFNDGMGGGGAELLAAGRRFNTISILSYVGGGVFLAGGVALVVLDLVGKKGTAVVRLGDTKVAATVVPVIGPGFYGASARLEL